MAATTGTKEYPDEWNAAGHLKSAFEYRYEEELYVLIAGKHMKTTETTWAFLAAQLKKCFAWNVYSSIALRFKFARLMDTTKGFRRHEREQVLAWPADSAQVRAIVAAIEAGDAIWVKSNGALVRNAKLAAVLAGVYRSARGRTADAGQITILPCHHRTVSSTSDVSTVFPDEEETGGCMEQCFNPLPFDHIGALPLMQQPDLGGESMMAPPKPEDIPGFHGLVRQVKVGDMSVPTMPVTKHNEAYFAAAIWWEKYENLRLHGFWGY